jgi:hypothetical protein
MASIAPCARTFRYGGEAKIANIKTVGIKS